ncbi:MAG TPA: SGNH/GDSL hydrolase family protein [Candidatus Hydrogenedentes bacterium]|nr:SGNH/GDSL hydrolase family protein [Candidatus Hydrogenedentota bacterium]
MTNNYGFRDDDVVLPKPPGVFRIVCVGGSTTEEGNDNASTYPNIMERKLQEWLNTDRIDVVNAGLCGLTSYTERRRINDYLELEPDLILYYNAVNDVCHKHFPPWLAAPNPWRGVLDRSRLLRRIFNRRLLPPDDYLVSFINATTMRNLRAMAVAARERNVRMAVCSFAYPTLSWHDFRARRYCDVNLREVWHGGPLYFAAYRQIMALYNRVLKRMCEEEGILYVPVAEHFIAGDDHFFDICHMTPVGLELKTNIIGAYMRDLLVGEGFAKNVSDSRDAFGSGR